MNKKTIVEWKLLLTSAVVLILSSCSKQTPATLETEAQKTANEIRAESLRPNNDPAGYALPLLASWNTGTYHYLGANLPRGFDPEYQLDLIEKGHFILPTFDFPRLDGDESAIEKMRPYYEKALKRAAALKLPICLMGTQWEQQLTLDKGYFDLPPEQNPNVVTPEGETQKKLSPFGPVQLWREIGTKWASSPLMKQLQQWYPDPPQIILLSNNESPKLSWEEVETDRHYLKKYGEGHDDAMKRKVVGDGWIERFRAMQEAMREHLSPTWQAKVLFVGYDAFGGGSFGRWTGWTGYSLYAPGRLEPYPLMWDGGTPSYYTNNWDGSTDYNVAGPQIQSMNWIFMQKQARQLNPDFRFGFSIWDGHTSEDDDKRLFYEKQGQNYNPARYSGFAQYGLWLLRPRVLREYRDWVDSVGNMEPWFLALVDDVDRVHRNETLRHFWRKGELVANRAHPHPYQSNIPDEYKNVNRWFLLDTNLDPPRPWQIDTRIPVFSLALVEGKNGNRRWLVYAHSPLEDRKDVEISIPGYDKVTVDVPIAGAFYLVDEKTKRVTSID